MRVEKQGRSGSQCLYPWSSTSSLALVTGSTWERNSVLSLRSFSLCLDYARGGAGIGWLCPHKQRSRPAQLHGALASLFQSSWVWKILKRKKKKKKKHEIVDCGSLFKRVKVIFLPGFQLHLQVTLVKAEVLYSVSADTREELPIHLHRLSEAAAGGGRKKKKISCLSLSPFLSGAMKINSGETSF